MKSCYLFLLMMILLISFAGFCQIAPLSPLPYALPSPAGWSKEIFPIPIDFAPSVPYRGQEELRFAPGWGDAKSPEYWSYAFVWFLDGHPDINEDSLQNNLQAYYTGLIGRNMEKRKIPKEKLFPVAAAIQPVLTKENADRGFRGEISMLDYMAQEPIILHVLITLRQCPSGHTAVLFKVSPAKEGQPVRRQLDEITDAFTCGK